MAVGTSFEEFPPGMRLPFIPGVSWPAGPTPKRPFDYNNTNYRMHRVDTPLDEYVISFLRAFTTPSAIYPTSSSSSYSDTTTSCRTSRFSDTIKALLEGPPTDGNTSATAPFPGEQADTQNEKGTDHTPVSDTKKVANLYGVLALTRDASEAGSIQAHKKLILKYHPDKAASENKQADTKMSKLVDQAVILRNAKGWRKYNFLLDGGNPIDRIHYDFLEFQPGASIKEVQVAYHMLIEKTVPEIRNANDRPSIERVKRYRKKLARHRAYLSNMKRNYAYNPALWDQGDLGNTAGRHESIWASSAEDDDTIEQDAQGDEEESVGRDVGNDEETGGFRENDGDEENDVDEEEDVVEEEETPPTYNTLYADLQLPVGSSIERVVEKYLLLRDECTARWQNATTLGQGDAETNYLHKLKQAFAVLGKTYTKFGYDYRLWEENISPRPLPSEQIAERNHTVLNDAKPEPSPHHPHPISSPKSPRSGAPPSTLPGDTTQPNTAPFETHQPLDPVPASSGDVHRRNSAYRETAYHHNAGPENRPEPSEPASGPVEPTPGHPIPEPRPALSQLSPRITASALPTYEANHRPGDTVANDHVLHPMEDVRDMWKGKGKATEWPLGESLGQDGPLCGPQGQPFGVPQSAPFIPVPPRAEWRWRGEDEELEELEIEVANQETAQMPANRTTEDVSLTVDTVMDEAPDMIEVRHSESVRPAQRFEDKALVMSVEPMDETEDQSAGAPFSHPPTQEFRESSEQFEDSAMDCSADKTFQHLERNETVNQNADGSIDWSSETASREPTEHHRAMHDVGNMEMKWKYSTNPQGPIYHHVPKVACTFGSGNAFTNPPPPQAAQYISTAPVPQNFTNAALPATQAHQILPAVAVPQISQASPSTERGNAGTQAQTQAMLPPTATSNHYIMLNLQVGATFAEVRPAYDGLFDDMERRQKTATAAQKAAIELEQKEVNKAYDMIGDEVRKSVYDHELWSLGLWPGAEPEMLVYVDEIDEQDELDHYAGDETIEIEDGLYETLELPRGSLHSLVHPQYLKQLDIWLNFLNDPNISQQERDGATQCVKVLKKARGILGDKQRKFNHDVELANAGLLGGEAVYGDDTETDRDELEAWIDTSAAFGGVPEGEDEEEAEGQYEEEVVEMVEGHGEES